MFKLIVLNSEADWVEEMLNRIGKRFIKRNYKHTTVFINPSKDTNCHSTFLGSVFLDTFKRMPSSIINELENKTYLLDHKGNYYQQLSFNSKPNYKTQSERYAKIKLYQLANIPRQDWIL